MNPYRMEFERKSMAVAYVITIGEFGFVWGLFILVK